MSYSQNSSSSQSTRGMGDEQRQYFSWQTPGEYAKIQNFSNQAAADPGGLSYMPTVDRLLPMGKYGVSANVDPAIFQFGKDMFSKASAARAMRGGGSPYNLEGVTGDAVRMASPTLIPLMNDFAFKRAQMAPQLQQMALGYMKTPMDVIAGLLSNSGTSGSSGSGWGAGWSDSGNTAAAGAAAAMSDRRLKSNIVRIGTHPLGIGWYEYDIAGRREQGVMAQELLEVKPEAVTTMPNGYLGVYYDMIGRM